MFEIGDLIMYGTNGVCRVTGFCSSPFDANDKREYYAVASELLEEKEKNKKLTAQINRDFENSSIPSSLQKDGRKKYQTAVKEQAEDRAVRQATKDTVVKSMP